MERDNQPLEPLEKTRYKAIVEYDGTDYLGFQRQIASQLTVQGEIERAINVIAQQPISTVGAGRTDTGVHASGQVISFLLDWRHGEQALHRAINANLPRDIVIRQLDVVSAEFHPRFDAMRRGYEYTIYNSKIRSPLIRRHSWHVQKPLDMVAMNQSAELLLGNHDFATFGQPPQGINTVRDVFKAEWRQEGAYFIFEIEATAFLKRMVRSIVGTLKQVGEGSFSAEKFATVFSAADRSQSGVTAPPQGLVFKKVWYK